MSAPRVEIVVEELVLRGVAPERAHAVAAAIETRLGELAGREVARLGPHSRTETSRRLAPVSAPAGDPAALGNAVAGAVWGSVAGRRTR